jgi:TRAP-type transport system periplasmic protein
LDRRSFGERLAWTAAGLQLLPLGVAGGCRDPDASRPLRMGHVYEPKSPTQRLGTDPLVASLAQRCSGLQLKVFGGAQLGSESELLEQLVAGELDLSIAGPSFLAMWHPPLGVFDAAYAFDSLEHMLEVADGPLMQPQWETLRQRFGIRVLATWAYGTRHLTSNRPIRHPDQLRGFRLRLPSTRVWQATGSALGASPMPMAFSEVYMALQQGICDGQENPLPVIQAMGFHEVQRYVSLTGHVQSSIQVLVSERSWQRLSVEEQDCLQQAVRRQGREVLAGTVAEEHTLLESWRGEGGMEIIDRLDLSAFRARARQFFEDGFAFSSLYQQISRSRLEQAGEE